MRNEIISLGVGNATLELYIPQCINEEKEAMLVIPGGGYGGLATGNEGDPIALAFASRGLATFILRYSVGEQLPANCPLAEASAAIAYIRRNSEELGIAKNKIYAVGFSAGGHLCASLATLWHDEEACKMAGVTPGENRADGVVLCYPVITSGEFAHRGSFRNLLGEGASREALEHYSLEKQVDERSSPAFMIHTAEDPGVKVENSLLLAMSYSRAKVPFELHVYPFGEHGFSLGNNVTNYWNKSLVDEKYARWVDDCIYFFRHLKQDK